MAKKWTLKQVKAKARKFTRRSDFQRECPDAYAAAVRHGWLNKIGIPLTKERWSEEKIILLVQTCSSRAELMTKFPTAYSAARRRKMLTKLSLPSTRWARKEDVVNEAMKYPTRSEFFRRAKGAYEKADREGWIRELYPHDMRTRAAKQASR